MNKTRILIIAVVIVVLFFAAIFSLYANLQTSQSSQEPTIIANITGFKVNWTPLPTVVGMTSVSTFDVTVQNLVTADLVGLNVTIERLADDNRSSPDDYFSYNNSFSLNSSQAVTIEVYLVANMVKTMEYQNINQNFLATLTCNSTVLVERRLY
jgi:hypothetical protein